MECSDARLVAFVSGELSPDEERALDEHLLGCEECWVAVREDHLGRVAVARLQEPASMSLEDRVRTSVALAARSDDEPPRFRGRTGDRRTPLVVLAAVAAGAFAWLGMWISSSRPSDPPQVAAVVAMLEAGAPSHALRAGEQLVIAGQRMAVRAYEIGSVEVVAATSDAAFATPASSEMLPGSSEHAWMARSGTMSLYGVNRAGSRRPSMFLVSSMPTEKLPEIAARLNLI